ncbi:MAG: hypothetical protein WCI22_14835, partial [Actinomycetota bacterium]
MASLVTTPQPPAVVSTMVLGPLGKGCVANVAAASNASSTVAARVTPAGRDADPWRLVPALGIAQIISWGALYYAIAVLGASIGAELALS